MFDNSSQFSKETSALRSVAVPRSLSPAERCAVLAAALRVAIPTETSLFANELLQALAEAGRPRTGWRLGRASLALRRLVGMRSSDFIPQTIAAALAARWSDLDPLVRSRAIGKARALLTRAAAEMQGRDVAARRSAACLIGDLGDLSLATLLGPIVVDRDAPAATAAERALVMLAAAAVGVERDDVSELLDIADWAAAPPAPGDTPPAPLRELRRELHARTAALAMAYANHRRPGTLLAAMVLLDTGAIAYTASRVHDPLARWFVDAGHESHMALRAALKRAPGAIARQRAWEWLGRDVADSACADRISRAVTRREHEAVLRRTHLLHNPARARRLAHQRVNTDHLHRGRGILPSLAQIKAMDSQARRGVLALARVLPIPAESIAEPVRALAHDADAAVRASALCAMPGAVAPHLTSDPDSRIAGLAGLYLGRAAPVARRDVGVRRRVTEASRSHMATHVMWIDVDPWDADSERSRTAARVLLARDRRAFERQIRGRVMGDDPRLGTSAIMVARRLAIAGMLELELLRIAASEPASCERERMIATAVAALGEIRTPAAMEALIACAAHPVDRIRANAVEAVLRPASGLELSGRLIELKDDRHHRVRANVLRALLLLPSRASAAALGAAADLANMLVDERPLHRLAGLWVVERAVMAGSRGRALHQRWNDLASRIADLARAEPEEPIRVRAARCGRLLLMQMRSDWEQRAPNLVLRKEAAA